MELAYATSFDSSNIGNWSGLGTYYAKMLQTSGFANLKCLDVHKKTLIHSPIDLIKSSLLGQEISPIFNIRQSKTYARLVTSKIGKSTHILSPNTVILAHLKKDLKKVLYTDSTLDNLLNFYSNYCGLNATAVAEAQQLEQLAIEKSDLLIYTSQWAADSAIRNYRADAKKIFIVPFGANLRFIPDRSDLRSIIRKRNIKKHINLLFVAVDWKRKGGEYAVEVVQELNRLGIPTTLHIAGVRDIPLDLDMKFIVNHGFISKGNLEQEKKLCKLILGSDYLLLPSRADCTPVVFSEANAFGVPCLASEVGGHPCIIKNGINGMIWPRSNFVENSVRYIADLVERKNSYEQLALSSYERYRNELNWKTTGDKISKLIHSI